jgi:hypothetical protein
VAPSTSSTDGHSSPTVAVIAAKADQEWVDRIVALLDMPVHRSVSEDDDVILLVASEATNQDAWLVNHVARRLEAGRRVIPIVTESELTDKLEILQELHWIEAQRAEDEALKRTLEHAIRIDSVTAAALGRLMTAADRWSRLGRHSRHLLNAAGLPSAVELWASVQADHAVLDESVMTAFLTASEQRAVRVRRWRRWTAASAILIFLAGSGVVGWRQLEQRAAADQAATADRERQASQAATVAADALRGGDERKSLQAAVIALDRASTRETRELSREVLSVPLPNVTFQLGTTTLTALAWSRTGRYLAVGSASGKLWMLDTTRRARAGAWTVGQNAVQRLRFTYLGDRPRIAYTLSLGTQGLVETTLTEVDSARDHPRAKTNTSTSSHEQAAATLLHGGVLLTAPWCRSDSNGSCTTWLPATSGTATSSLWSPHEPVLAVTTSGGDVDLINAKAALSKSTAVVTPATSPPQPGVWAGYLAKEDRTVLVSPAGTAQLATRDNVPSGGDQFTCLPMVKRKNLGRELSARVWSVDCRGAVRWSVTTDDIATALPTEARSYPQPPREPVSIAPAIEVGPTGTTALALDNAGRGYMLALRTGWTVVLRTTSAIHSDVELAGVVFTSDGTAAAAMLRPRDGGAASVLSFDLTRRTTRSLDIGAVSPNARLHAFSDNRETIALGDDAVGTTRSFLLINVHSRERIVATGSVGIPVGFDTTGERLLTLGGETRSVPWPPALQTEHVTLAFARIYNARNGELLCEAPFYQPSQPVAFVAPDLSAFVVDSYERPLLQHTCRPVDDLRASLIERLGSYVAIGSP